jgi:hypothetical protein
MIHELTDLPAGGADRQGAGCFEDHRRRLQESLKESPKLPQSFLAAIGSWGLLEPRGAEPVSTLSKAHGSAGQYGVYQDLADFSALLGQPVRKLWIVDFL